MTTEMIAGLDTAGFEALVHEITDNFARRGIEATSISIVAPEKAADGAAPANLVFTLYAMVDKAQNLKG